VQWFRGGLVFKVHRLCVSLNSRLESNKEEEKVATGQPPPKKRTWFRVHGLLTRVGFGIWG